MRRQPRMRKAPPLFRYRLVLTIAPWGVITIAAATAVALAFRLTLVSNIICLTVVAIAVTGVWRMQVMVRELQFTVHHLKYDIDNDDLNLDPAYQKWLARQPHDDDDDPIAHRIPSKKINNDAHDSRIPER